MVRIGLQIKAQLENIEELKIDENYSFIFKIKCLNCGECDAKWHSIRQSDTFPLKTGRATCHYLATCKLCSRENNLAIIDGSLNAYTNTGRFETIAIFECRGIEPIDFQPASDSWQAISSSEQIFHDIDLSTKEWVDYDESTKEPVGIYELESQFIKTK